MKSVSLVERVLVGLVMAVLVVAALGKLLDPGGFRASLDSWAFIPTAVQGPLSMGVPLLEIAIAAAWFLGLHRAAMAWLAAGLIASFTGLYAVHLAFSSPPDCHCLGLIVSFDRGQAFAENLLVRNGVLLGMLGVAGVLAIMRTRAGRAEPRSVRGASVHGVAAPGFTLVETLLVIALIGILIGLVLPYLAGARDKAQEVGALALIRGHGQILQTYSADYAGYFPVIGHPDRPTTIQAGGREIEVQYWHADFHWIYALADQYYNGRIGHPSLFPPGYEDGGSPFKYTESYLAVPDFWATETRTGRQQWRAVPAALTAYPSAKGLLTSWAARVPVPGKPATYSSPDDMPQETAFADGSARTIVRREFQPWVLTGEGDYPGRETTPLGWPVLHTLNGTQGRDVK